MCPLLAPCHIRSYREGEDAAKKVHIFFMNKIVRTWIRKKFDLVDFFDVETQMESAVSQVETTAKITFQWRFEEREKR